MKMLPEVYADDPDHKFKNWIDLGAGDGGALIRGPSLLTEKMSTTEICPVMRKRLEWRGFTVEGCDFTDLNVQCLFKIRIIGIKRRRNGMLSLC